MLPNFSDLTKAKNSPEYKRLKALLKDREWRIDNLYWIKDEQGAAIPFRRNVAQLKYHAAAWFRDIIPKARKLGFSTYIAILILDDCLFVKGTTAGIVDRSLDDACDKLAMIKFAYDRLPEQLRIAIPLLLSNQKELSWKNGSAVTVGTTYRGGTPMLLHVSEFGPVSAESPDVAIEIKNGAIQAVPSTGRVWVESTTHGTAGEFYNMVQRAEATSKQGHQLTPLDFKMHFYGWWIKPEYRLPNHLVHITHELKEYFSRIAPQLLAQGVRLDADQQAWYAKKYEELGPDYVRQEFPSIPEELFAASIEGAYFKAEMSKARADGRIGQIVPHDPTRRVNTFWDIGEDGTAILFHQTDGLRHRFIDYYEEEGGSLQSAAGVLEDKRISRKFMYDKHYGPHDLGNKDWAHAAQSRKETAEGLGIKFTVVPRVLVKADSIEAARRMITLSWFDVTHCSLLVERLDNYRKKWNKSLGQFSAEPEHKKPSHCFVGTTKILTPSGAQCINALPENGEVLTLCGIQAYRSLRITRRAAQLVVVQFKSGLSVKCTPDHMFLTESGWKSAELLQPGGVIRSIWTANLSSSTVRFTGSMIPKSILPTGAGSFIGMCGRRLLVIFQNAAMSTIGMKIQQTTVWKTLNAWMVLTIRASLGSFERQEVLRLRLATWPDQELSSGTSRMKGALGTVSTPERTHLGANLIRKNGSVWSAAKSMMQSLGRIFRNGSAIQTADQIIIEKTERLNETADVWCLTVLGVEHFCLENGAVVHNCADALQCGSMGLAPERIPREARHRPERKTSSWGA